MDIRNSLDGLKSLLGATPSAPASSQTKTVSSNGPSALPSDQATFSSAGSAVASAASDGGVRMDKVASIQAALAAGTYNIAPSAVASRMVDAMMGGAN